MLAVVLCAGAGPAEADHEFFGRVSDGEVKGNGNNISSFRAASADGSRVFFVTNEQLVASDTDVFEDVYERAGGTTTKISPGSGAFNAFFDDTSADGSRVVFSTLEKLAPTDTDASTDLYQQAGGVTTHVSRGGVNGNGAFIPQFQGASADGSRIFFVTLEALVGSDLDSTLDVYERSGSTTKLVSAGQINGNGDFPAPFRGASADGTAVYFDSREQLVGGDDDNAIDAYKRVGGTTTLVSTGPVNGDGAFDINLRRVSATGSRAFFETREALVGSDTDGALDIYERNGGTTTLVSAGQINGNGAVDAFFAGATPDGSRVFFQTDEQLTNDDLDNSPDIYERAAGTTTRVTAGDVNGNGNIGAFFAAASDDGSRVFFISSEGLVAGDVDGFPDLYERSGGTTKQVSIGQVNGNGGFFITFSGISKNGAKVFFQTGEQLTTDDVDTSQDVYERVGGHTTLISPGNFIGSSDASLVGLSDDGSRAFFTTPEPVVKGDTDTTPDTYGAYTAPGSGPPGARHPLFARISTGEINGNTGFGSFHVGSSPDGSRAFFTTPEKLVPSDTDSSNDIYEHSEGTTNRVSVGEINGNGAFTNNFSATAASGSIVYFNTSEPLVAADTDTAIDVYQRAGGVTKRISAGVVNGNGPFGAAFERASKDGSRVVFSTDEQLVAGDTDSVTDIYQRSGDATKLISAGAVNGNGAFPVQFQDASDDLSRVFFRTGEQLVGADTDAVFDLYERFGTTTTLVSAGEINGNTNDNVFFGGASADGTRVFFETQERLVPSDADPAKDVYERSGGTTKRVSAGSVNGNSDLNAVFSGASADGTKVFFLTDEQLGADDTDTARDLYRRSAGSTSRISVGQVNGNGGKGVHFNAVSEDGNRVFFETREKLVAADTDGEDDVYERSGGTTTRVTTGEINGNGPQSATLSRISTDGSRVFFHTLEQLVPADTDANTDVYERAGGRTNLITPGDAFASISGISDDGSVVFFSTSEGTIASDVDGTSDAYGAYLSP